LVVLLFDTLQFPTLQRNHADAAELGTDALRVQKLEHEYNSVPCMSTGVKTVNGVDFSVSPGAMLGFLGPNGAGKTTTIRCITGEEFAVAGKVSFRPRKLAERSNYEGLRRRSVGSVVRSGPLSAAISGKDTLASGDNTPPLEGHGQEGSSALCETTYIGLCPQETALADDLTVEQHLWLFACIRESPEPSWCAEDFLKIVKLQEKRNEVPSHLSGGMRRRLSIAISMVADPDVALLDEPTTGLDPMTRRNIWEAIMDARNLGTACLLTTHMLEEAEYLSTNIIILTQGKIAAQGSVQQLKDQYSCGYMLTIDSQTGRNAEAKTYISSILPHENREPIQASMHGNMSFNVSKDSKVVGRLFLELAENAEAHGIRTWGISQANLEDAYLKIISNAK
jgi:ABC-type multidrug transport system ATPase subunit